MDATQEKKTAEKNISEKLLYQLQVLSGKKVFEQGNFFLAMPFTLEFTLNGKMQEMQVFFKRGSQNKVVYQIHDLSRSVNSLLAEWTHPDYLPETSPGVYPDPLDLDERTALLCAAFVALHISKDARYLKAFAFPLLAADSLGLASKPPSPAMASLPPPKSESRSFSFTVKQKFSKRSMYEA